MNAFSETERYCQKCSTTEIPAHEVKGCIYGHILCHVCVEKHDNLKTVHPAETKGKGHLCFICYFQSLEKDDSVEPLIRNRELTTLAETFCVGLTATALKVNISLDTDTHVWQVRGHGLHMSIFNQYTCRTHEEMVQDLDYAISLLD